MQSTATTYSNTEWTVPQKQLPSDTHPLELLSLPIAVSQFLSYSFFPTVRHEVNHTYLFAYDTDQSLDILAFEMSLFLSQDPQLLCYKGDSSSRVRTRMHARTHAHTHTHTHTRAGMIGT